MDERKLQVFVAQAKHMRQLQKKFFKGDKTVISASKAAEARLDKMIQEFESQQQSIF